MGSRTRWLVICAVLGSCGDNRGGPADAGPEQPSDAPGPDAPPGVLTNVPDHTWVTDSDVNAIVRVGSTIYIGGNFTRVGPRTGPGVELGLDGTLIASPEIAGAGPNTGGGAATGVRAVTSDGVGGWYVAGLFTHVGGTAHVNLAHILADGTVDPAFSPAVDGNVEALALSGTTLYIAGQFAHVAGQARSNIAAVSTTDGSATAFAPDADAEVAALAIVGPIVYAGGNGFTTIGGKPRASLAALDATTGVATSFAPVIASTNGLPNILTIATIGTTIYIGGYFDTVNGTARRTIAALAPDGTSVASFAPEPSYFGCLPCATVVAIAVSGTTVYAGGSFDTIGGSARDNLAGLNATTGAATAFDPSANGNILALAASATTVYAGGGFQMIGGAARHYVAALDASTGVASAFDPDPNNSVNAIAVAGTSVYLGGSFTSFGGMVRAGLVAFDATTGEPTAWDPHATGPNGNLAQINAIVASGSTLYIGGSFETIGGAARSNVAALDLASATATAWNPSSDGSVDALAIDPTGLVYAGGEFLSIGGKQRVFIAALDGATGAATAWDPSADNSVRALALGDHVVYAGGMFAQIGGAQVFALAELDAATGHATTWTANLGPGMFGAYVYALAVDGPSLFIGGGFGSVQGIARHNAAAVSLADATPTVFDPQTADGPDDGAVSAIAIDGDKVFLGGSFATMSGESRALIGAASHADGAVLAFDPNGFGGVAVHAIAVANHTVYVGGSFPTFDLASQQGFASFSPHPQ